MKKNFIVALGVATLILANPLSFSYAKSEIVEGRAYKMAEQYIENSLTDEAWKDNNPVISGQKKYYTDDEKKVSYIEYKISCDSNPDCGFIMMNVDGNDVTVPIASPSGNTPSEILDQGTNIEEKLYYFGPFDLYSENEISGDVQALDPQLAVDLRDDTQVKRNTEEKKAVKEQKEALKAKLKEAKLAAKEFKKSDEFKKQKEEIKDQILTVPKEEFSMKILDMAEAVNYTSPGSSNIFIPGGNYTVGCNGQTPCYNQFTQNYNSSSCKSGCTPNALGIIFGWYDRNGFPKLVSGTTLAARTNNTDINTMINSIRTYMGTYCSNGEGLTLWTNTDLGIQYAKDKGYTNSSITDTDVSSWSSYNLFTNINTEVDNGRPSILHIAKPPYGDYAHSVVVFGYRYATSPYVVRMNMGWGGGILNNGYFGSNIDQNLSSIYYNSTLGYSHKPFGLSRVYLN